MKGGHWWRDEIWLIDFFVEKKNIWNFLYKNDCFEFHSFNYSAEKKISSLRNCWKKETLGNNEMFKMTAWNQDYTEASMKPSEEKMWYMYYHVTYAKLMDNGLLNIPPEKSKQSGQKIRETVFGRRRARKLMRVCFGLICEERRDIVWLVWEKDIICTFLKWFWKKTSLWKKIIWEPLLLTLVTFLHTHVSLFLVSVEHM